MSKKSKFLGINWSDLIKGFVVAIIAALVTTVYKAIEENTFELSWNFFQPVLLTSLGAGLAYLVKNWLTNSNDQFLKTE